MLLLFICVTAYSNNPLGFLFFQPEVPGSRGRRTGKGAGRNPAMWVAGGEGKEAREVKWARANLLMGSKRKIGGWMVLVDVE